MKTLIIIVMLLAAATYSQEKYDYFLIETKTTSHSSPPVIINNYNYFIVTDGEGWDSRTGIFNYNRYPNYGYNNYYKNICFWEGDVKYELYGGGSYNSYPAFPPFSYYTQYRKSIFNKKCYWE